MQLLKKNPAVFSWEVHFEDKKENMFWQCQNYSASKLLLPSNSIYIILYYNGTNENMKMKDKPNTTKNILDQLLLVHF